MHVEQKYIFDWVRRTTLMCAAASMRVSARIRQHGIIDDGGGNTQKTNTVKTSNRQFTCRSIANKHMKGAFQSQVVLKTAAFAPAPEGRATERTLVSTVRSMRGSTEPTCALQPFCITVVVDFMGAQSTPAVHKPPFHVCCILDHIASGIFAR